MRTTRQDLEVAKGLFPSMDNSIAKPLVRGRFKGLICIGKAGIEGSWRILEGLGLHLLLQAGVTLKIPRCGSFPIAPDKTYLNIRGFY
jgi:hypothetical protein